MYLLYLHYKYGAIYDIKVIVFKMEKNLQLP